MKSFSTGNSLKISMPTKIGWILIHFESCQPGAYYRIFQKPSGRFVGLETMEAPKDWKFLFSIKMPVDITVV